MNASRVRVKICGLTDAVEAAAVAALGADAIGIVFYAPSPRAVMDLGRAREIAQAAGAFCQVVGLFVDAAPAEVEAVLRAVPINCLQFHGCECAADCERFERPYIKAVPMRDGLDFHQLFDDYRRAQALLLDAYRPGVPGGTGEVFDWRRVPPPDLRRRPLVLAGGLTPALVADAVRQAQVTALDVSGGVEAARGRKDPAKVAAFIAAANAAGEWSRQ